MTEQIRRTVPDATPGEVKHYVHENEPRVPVSDSTLGIEVPRGAAAASNHRLVVIGDSLSHGFQSGAIFNTEISYPAIIAHELGWFANYRYPKYPYAGGLPFNLEVLLRRAERRFGLEITGWRELRQAAVDVRNLMDTIETYWENEDLRHVPPVPEINHCLAMYGWDLRDALEMTAARCRAAITPPKNNFLKQWVEHASERAALRVYPQLPEDQDMTFFDAAERLGEDGGIETLIVFLGANNALQVVTRLKVEWSEENFADLEGKRKYTIWQPAHFKVELDEVVQRVRRIKAEHVIWCTVPHVTIAPIARGVGVKKGARYFDHYTRPWIADADFDPRKDKCITGDQARAVDGAIDMYNDAITDVVRVARNQQLDWHLLDIAGLMDRLAHRRYVRDVSARPDWWSEYPLPPAPAALSPKLDSQFLTGDGIGGRRTGGLFSLDGVHPTTVAYGIIAQEMITIMRGAGVEFLDARGNPRPDPVGVDFKRLIQCDTLVQAPPQNIGFGLHSLGWLDETFGWVMRSSGVDIG